MKLLWVLKFDGPSSAEGLLAELGDHDIDEDLVWSQVKTF